MVCPIRVSPVSDMIVDGRQTENVPDTVYDVIVVGAGPAGITLAHELRDTGLRIALLESGGEEFDAAAQDLNEGTLKGNEDYDLGGSRLRFLGGTSNHWGGQCTPFDPIDFDRAPEGFSGWPMPYDEMVPFWQRAHDYCDVGAYRYDARELAPGDPDLWILPDAPEVETVVLRQSAPTRFGEKYRADLAASETVHLWLWTTAIRVSTTGGSETEQVVTRTIEGTERAFTARAVVLAAGAIEATRLLMWSNIENATSAGNAGDLLGRCYMDHLAGGVGLLHFDTPVDEKIYWNGLHTHADDGIGLHFGLHLSEDTLRSRGLTNAIFPLVPMTEKKDLQRRERAKHAFNAMKGLVKWPLGRDVGAEFDPGAAYCTMTENADALVADKVAGLMGRGGYTQALLRYEAEELPRRTSGLALDPQERDALGMPRPVLTWEPAEDDIEAVRQSGIEIGKAAGAAGLGRFELEDHDDDPYWNVVTAWHQLGTLRMAQSPTSGVTDPDGRVHGAGALYVASGAVFPTGGRANPTLTIVALAIRLADHLQQRMAT